MVCGTVGTVAGIALIVVPVVVYQWDTLHPPLGHAWPEPFYPLLCIVLGGIGGTLMVPSSTSSVSSSSWSASATVSTSSYTDVESVSLSSPPGRHGSGGAIGGGWIWTDEQSKWCTCRGGYRWVGGLLGGASSSGLAYLASWVISQHAAGNIIDVPLILFCSVPGLIVYSLVHQCSDYTFPSHSRHNGNHQHQQYYRNDYGSTSHNRMSSNSNKHQRPSFSTVSPPTMRR